MNLSRKQFDVLRFLETVRKENVSQREIAKRTKLSLGTVNKTVMSLQQLNLVVNGHISDAGLEALEPFRVKRAILLAAGFGSRLVPITLNTPKPLVRVKGVRMIDTLLDALLGVGINDITIVRGYLGEQFDQLLFKYPNLQFVENPVYNETNSISSAMCVRDKLCNAYVMDADMLLYNKNLISKYQYISNYLGVAMDKTDDWCLVTKNKIITEMKLGGYNCYQMFGFSYWNEVDGKKLAGHIKDVYEMPGGKERFWDQVALEMFIKEYKIEIRECTFDDIVEIDNFSELKVLDNSYC